jgi:hypothetical protein
LQRFLSDLKTEVAPISEIQQQLRAHDSAHLAVNDRVAHQYEIAGGKVLLRIEVQLPENFRGVGLFQPEREYTGIGRISTGLGCPHNENIPDFLSIRLAFLGINHPASPTDNHVQFIKLFQAAAGAAGSGVVSSNLILHASLTSSVGPVQGAETFAHVVDQT